MSNMHRFCISIFTLLHQWEEAKTANRFSVEFGAAVLISIRNEEYSSKLGFTYEAIVASVNPSVYLSLLQDKLDDLDRAMEPGPMFPSARAGR